MRGGLLICLLCAVSCRPSQCESVAKRVTSCEIFSGPKSDYLATCQAADDPESQRELADAQRCAAQHKDCQALKRCFYVAELQRVADEAKTMLDDDRLQAAASLCADYPASERALHPPLQRGCVAILRRRLDELYLALNAEERGPHLCSEAETLARAISPGEYANAHSRCVGD